MKFPFPYNLWYRLNKVTAWLYWHAGKSPLIERVNFWVARHWIDWWLALDKEGRDALA